MIHPPTHTASRPERDLGLSDGLSSRSVRSSAMVRRYSHAPTQDRSSVMITRYRVNCGPGWVHGCVVSTPRMALAPSQRATLRPASQDGVGFESTGNVEAGQWQRSVARFFCARRKMPAHH